jgi:drug/metabolite transporter (DMT)-like permease
MILAGLSFGFMGVFVKIGAETLSTAELVFYRCAAGLIVISLMTLPRKQSFKVSPAMLRLHLSRSISGFIALLFYFYAISQLPLPTAVTLNYTSPLFFVFLVLLQQKKWPQWQLLCSVALGFVGVVLLLKPTFSAAQWLPGILGLLSGFLASVAYLNVNELGKAGEPEWRTVFYFSLVSTLGAGILMAFQSTSLHRPDLSGWLVILGMGITATLAQLSMTRAYRKGRSMVVVSLAYLTVLFSTLLSWIIWGASPSGSAILAMLLIVGAGIWSSATRSQRA